MYVLHAFFVCYILYILYILYVFFFIYLLSAYVIFFLHCFSSLPFRLLCCMFLVTDCICSFKMLNTRDICVLYASFCTLYVLSTSSALCFWYALYILAHSLNVCHLINTSEICVFCACVYCIHVWHRYICRYHMHYIYVYMNFLCFKHVLYASYGTHFFVSFDRPDLRFKWFAKFKRHEYFFLCIACIVCIVLWLTYFKFLYTLFASIVVLVAAVVKICMMIVWNVYHNVHRQKFTLRFWIVYDHCIPYMQICCCCHMHGFHCFISNVNTIYFW